MGMKPLLPEGIAKVITYISKFVLLLYVFLFPCFLSMTWELEIIEG